MEPYIFYSTLGKPKQRAPKSVFPQLHPHLPHPHLTSSALHAAPFPTTVGPEKQSVLWLGGLTLIFSALVYRYGVFVMNSIILVVKQQHLEPREEGGLVETE